MKKNKEQEDLEMKLFCRGEKEKEEVDIINKDEIGDSRKRYKVFSFKKIKEIIRDYIKKANLTKENLNEFHKIFKLSDLEPDVNYLYLSIIKEIDGNKFNKYICKYLYTLNYKEAKKIDINLMTREEKEIKKLKEFRLDNGINEEIKPIDSLSKIMLINFIYQINDYYKNEKEINDFINLFSEYKIDIYLKYRLPNFCGSEELIFYTYLQLFIDIFYFEDEEMQIEVDESKDIDKRDKKEENMNKINNIDISEDSIDEECFSLSDWTGEENKSFEFNNDIINKDINEFSSFINENKKNIIIKDKFNDDELSERNFRITNLYLKYLNIFDNFIKEKIILDYDKKDFIDKIDFIYFTLTYFRYNNKNDKVDEFIKYSLYEPENKRLKSIKLLNCGQKHRDYLKTLSEEKKESLIFSNLINYKGHIKDIIDNPFINRAKFYKFPFNMEKNIIKFNSVFYEEFEKFMLNIYESKLFKEIFYLTEEFKDFLYPFEGEEKENIFKEMFNNTKFYPFEFDYLTGFTSKLIPEILISSILKDYSNFEKIIISISYLINTVFHEQMKHYIKMLLHFNSLRLSLSVSLESDKPLNDDLFEKYLKVVKKKKEILNYLEINEKELKEIKESDGGDKLEILLYGQKLQHLYVNGALYILDISSYNKSITEHLKEFLEKNKPFNKLVLNEEKLERLPLIKKLIDLNNNNPACKRIFREELNGNIALQTESSATQIPGYSFLECRRISVKDRYFGTS